MEDSITINPTPVLNDDKNNIINERIYTSINNASCDCRTIRLLKNLIAGRYGELTALHTYLFQNIILGNSNPNLTTALNNILLDEVLHTKLLGNAILSFGGVPRFSNGQGNFWSARNVNYSTNTSDFINSNISLLQRQINDYRQAISKISNQSLISLLNEIIEDKNKHIKILQGLI